MRLALAQLDFTVGAFEENFRRMRDAVARAAAAHADLVVFSELATTGYPPRDLLTQSGFVDRNLALLDRVAALSTGTLGILIGFVDRNPAPGGRPLFNAVALCTAGRVAERRYKSLLPTYDVFDEDRYFEPAAAVSPIEYRGWRLGVTICEDLWNPREFWARPRYRRDPVAELAAADPHVLINVSSSPFELRKAALRRDLVRQGARTHQRYFFYVNQVGGNDELVFDGHSVGIAPDGSEVVRAGAFVEDFVLIDVPTESGAPSPDRVLRPVADGEEAMAHQALVLGVRDYVGKCGFRTAVLGLSGGIDSAVTACLAAEALGPGQVTGVLMPSRYSSRHSVEDARALAEHLGIPSLLLPIDGVVQAYLDALGPMRAAADASPDGLTEQNLQARVRGALLMAHSNTYGSMLLTTGNKSELAVGYCTLYGDMCGGLAVISDVPKTLVYRLARYINRSRPVIPESTLTKAPSAELKPDQTDQDTLPSYEVLDRIIEGYVEQGLDAAAIAAQGIDRGTVDAMVRRINLSEYKRRQAAPGLKISSKAFGVGRRFPIAARFADP
ncbi:MAG: NAD+ synthase [Acidimicrobiia bacterium]|nr:NAD+ synthase [Acidimicrobiia bacterium]